MSGGVYKKTPEHREKLRQSWSAADREKARQRQLRYMASPKARERVRQAQLGRTRSPETRERMRQAKLGFKHSPETRAKMTRMMFKRWASPDMREKYCQSAARPQTRKKHRQARLRYIFPQKMTPIERLLHTEFKKRRLKFEMHKSMFGRFQPDFVFEQAHLIVQADGDYWHSRPEVRKRDAVFNEAAKDGWTVWRFGEKEVHMHPAACARAVARFVRDH